jgi:precorrin-6B methylase 2
MATDYARMTQNLLTFYDFKNKTMICIGAGGGQFIGYSEPPKKIIAIDQDAGALEQFRLAVARNNIADKFELIHGDFLTMDLPVHGDVVLFEFCLHEMADAAVALARAGKLADDVVVFDHGLKSQWAYHVVEEEKVRVSWQAVKRFKVSRHREYAAEQKFKDYDELLAKVKPQGEIAIQRIEKFKGKMDITIPFTYELALVNFP